MKLTPLAQNEIKETKDKEMRGRKEKTSTYSTKLTPRVLVGKPLLIAVVAHFRSKCRLHLRIER